MQSNSAVTARRERIGRDWGLVRGAVIIPSGLHVPVQGTDQYHEFHAHPEFSYLAGAQLPGAVVTFDEASGWLLFAPEADLEDRVWVGDGVDHVELATRTGLTVKPLAQLQPWLEQRRAEPLAILGNHDITHSAGGYGIRNWGSLELDIDETLAERLSTEVAEARRAKDAAEIELMQGAADASAAGHIYALRQARPGLTERQLQIEVEAEFFRAGAERTAYGSIVGTGSNGAVLHFSPTQRVMREGEIVLMDAGAEFEGYASDVTRTFPVGRRFEGAQRDIYQLVLDVQQAAIKAAKDLASSTRICISRPATRLLRGWPTSAS